jgi:hypothetical protein
MCKPTSGNGKSNRSRRSKKMQNIDNVLIALFERANRPLVKPKVYLWAGSTGQLIRHLKQKKTRPPKVLGLK